MHQSALDALHVSFEKTERHQSVFTSSLLNLNAEVRALKSLKEDI